ncbi:MAG: DUF4367 domain-containing protein [Oscillospiraceae bacterium]|jgi:hypothetical protein|nr:DUF4367 domain-containing protein [Oscillospiraceae bacterium]
MNTRLFTEQELKLAFIEYGKNLADSLTAEESAPEHEFSPEFERQMEELIRSIEPKKPFASRNRGVKRAAVIVIAAIISASILVLSVSALRNAVTGFFVNIFNRFSIIMHIKDGEESALSTLEQLYEPVFIPEGYYRESEEKVPAQYRITYSNGVDKIIFRQRVSDGTFIDTEKAPYEEIQVGGRKGIYYKVNDVSYVIWEEAAYRFRISSKLDKEILITTAESVKTADK